MTENESFDRIRSGLKAGEADATQEVFERFAQRLIGLAHTRLDQQLRRKVAAEDVMQSVFRSFIRRNNDEPFDVRSWDNLWSLLVVMTVRKCGRQVRWHRAARRDVSREVSGPSGEDGAGWLLQTTDGEPTPDEAVMLSETVQELMRGWDDREQKIISMRLQGFSLEEIAAEVGRTERTVQRLLAQVKRRLQQHCEGEQEEP